MDDQKINDNMRQKERERQTLRIRMHMRVCNTHSHIEQV
jgi:hypothetical protein